MSTTLSGWMTAAKYLGPGVSPMRVRRAVKRGDLKAMKGDNGSYSFELRDLDVFRETLGLGSRAGDGVFGEVGAEVSTSDVAPAAPSMSRVTASWLLAAAGRRESDPDDDGDDAAVEDEEEQKPRPANVNATPLGASRSPHRELRFEIVERHEAANAQALQGELAVVTAQLASAQAELATVQAERDQLRVAWRGERTRAIAAAEALTAVGGGVPLEIASTIGNAAAQALSAMPDEPLSIDQVAVGVARSAAMQAAAAIEQQIAWHREIERQHRGVNDIDRARDRRGMRRRRSR